MRGKVDGFAAAVAERRQADLHCRAGCAGCCRVELTVSAVEAAAIRAHFAALSEDARGRLRERLRAARSLATTADGPRCHLLLDDERCAVYPARPLVCRSQGLPLVYGRDVLPAESRYGETADGRAVTWCPLNFADRPPGREDALDAERVDVLLALINRRFVAASGASADERYPLADLAAEFVE